MTPAERFWARVVPNRLRRDGGWDRRYVISSLPLPSVEDTRIPIVRLLNLTLSMAVLWFVVVVWALSLLMEGGAS